MLSRTFVLDELLCHPAAHPFRRTVLLWSAALMMVEGYDMQIMGSAAPAMITALHASKASFSLVFSIGLAGYMIGAIGLGSLGDRIGRKRTMVLGTLMFGCCTLATAWLSSLIAIKGLRLLAGVGIGVAVPTTIALNAEFAAANERGKRIGRMYIGYMLGGAASGVVASLLLPRFGWQILFVIGGLLPILIGTAMTFFITEAPGFLLLTPTRTAELSRVMQRIRPDIRLTAQDVLIAKGSGPIAGAPLRHLFTEGRALMTGILSASFILVFMTLHLLTSWLPTLLNEAGLSQSRAALVGATFLVGGVAGALVIGPLLDRRGAIAASALLLLSAPCIALIGVVGNGATALALAILLAGAVLQGGQVGFNAVAATFYPTAIRSTGAGWALGIGRLGSIVGPIIGGLLLSEGASDTVVFVVAAAPVFLGGLCSLLLAFHQARQVA